MICPRATWRRTSGSPPAGSRRAPAGSAAPASRSAPADSPGSDRSPPHARPAAAQAPAVQAPGVPVPVPVPARCLRRSLRCLLHARPAPGAVLREHLRNDVTARALDLGQVRDAAGFKSGFLVADLGQSEGAADGAERALALVELPVDLLGRRH